ncbi:hypothetical protein BC962_3040 [Gillisia mitskevichiae]|uniref:Uncharacterized protein n=1 Tax=Gillisia mitskevichiae TaxID=270921 RepID=A0A495NXD1_9FLAO|nr:hypothetical protein [Gillisia mitskevichiae]RKS42753.1 hypothetical protein BC962_3040 [Gillisia mitskevichiae]
MTDMEIMPLIIGLGAPILIALGGIITWFLKSRKEDLQAIEERALERRIETYNELLHPLIVLFSKNASKKTKDLATSKMGSVEYRKAAFNLITFGSDEMVVSYNEMMQSFYKNEAENDIKTAMQKFASFILSIRKDVNNKNTKLREWDMLKFMITDIDKIIKK